MPGRNFYIEWGTRAFGAAVEFTGYKHPKDIVRSLILWAVAVAVLYFVDWRGLPLIGTVDAGIGGEVRLGICAVVALLALFTLSFVRQLLVQPNRIYSDLLDRIDETEKVISAIADTEADRLYLSAAHVDGFRLYRAQIDQSDPASVARWRADMDAWVEKIKAHLSARWSISALHEFQDLSSMGGFQYKRDDADLFLGERMI